MEQIRLIIADDHPLVTEGFCSVISQNYRDLRIVAAVANGREAVAEAGRLHPHVLLMDVKMPVMDGIQATREIRRRDPSIRVIMLTTYGEKQYVQGALDEGAVGYILKDTPIAEVVLAVRAVHKGNVVFPQDLMELVRPGEGRADVRRQTRTGVDTLNEHAELANLSQREKEVLVLMARGLMNAQIGDRLSLSDGTVRNYVHRIYDALGVHNRTAVVLWAFEQGIR